MITKEKTKRTLPKIQQVRIPYKPFAYPQYFEYFKRAVATVWRVETVDMNNDIKDYLIRSTEDEKEIIAGVLKGFTILETHIGDYWSDRVCKMFPKHEIVAAARANAFYECFDKDTELLTSSGWKNVQSLSDNDLFAQYNQETKEIDFVKAQKLVKYPYKGIMHYYQSKNTDICVTPNHDMLAYNPTSKKLDKVKSYQRKLGRNYQYPNSGYSNYKGSDLTDYERLLIAIQAEGHLFLDRDNYVQINLTKKRKVDKLKSYLDNLSINYKETINTNNQTVFSFNLDFNKTSNKNFNFIKLDELSTKKAKSIIEEVIFWDGTSKGSGYYYNTNEQAIDKIQAVASLCGIRAQKGINRTAKQSLSVLLPQGDNPKTTKTCYVLSFKNQEIGKEYTTYPYVQEVEYDDYVYCLTVDTHNVITRRLNKISITGQCIHSQAYAHLNDSLGLDDYKAFLNDPITRKKIEYFIEHENDLVSLAVFSGAGEGVSLFSSFAILLSMSRDSRYKGLAQIISWSIRDEHEHSEMGCSLFRDLVSERGITEEEKKLVYQGFDVVLQNEFEFIDTIFNNRTVEYITPTELKEYMYYRANNRLKALDLEPKYKVGKEAYILRDWFEVEALGQSSNDFFWQSLSGDNYTSLLSQDFKEYNYSNVNLNFKD